MAQNAEIFFEHDSWGHALAWSAGFHVVLTAIILLFPLLFAGSRESDWGSGGGGSAMGVTLVSSVPLSVAHHGDHDPEDLAALVRLLREAGALRVKATGPRAL